MNPVLESGQLTLKELFASTLIHSLWQGAVIVSLMWLIRIVFRKSTNLNYVLSLMALILMMMTSLFTFIHFWTQNTVGFYSDSFLSETLSRPDFLDWFNVIWFIGATFFFFRFLLSHYYLRNLIRNSELIQNDKWLELFTSIKIYYSLHKSVILLQSEKVSSAFLTGVIKPVIIIPTSWVNQLSYREAECILAHELSHIVNRDHWVNLFIHFAEIIFYFNPAVHILIGHIKLERELKADKSACDYLKEPMLYAKLIIKIEEATTVVPAFTLPFFGQKKQLKRRIESVLQIKTSGKDFTSKIALFGLIISVLLFSSVKLGTPLNQHCLLEIQPKPCTKELLFEPIVKIKTKNLIDKDEIVIQSKPELVKVHKEITLVSDKKIKSSQQLSVDEIAEEESESELIAFHSDAENVLEKIEREIQSDKKVKRTIIYEISKSVTDTTETVQGGNWTLPRQIRYYAPSENKTYIIIKTRNAPTYESEPDWNSPGRVRFLMRDKN